MVPPVSASSVAGIALTITFTVLLLVAEHRASRLGRALTKPLASTGFVLAALGAGALDDAPGRWVLAGLLLSMLGDVLLIPGGSRTFLAGLGSFLLGHLAFAIAFSVRGLDVAVTGAALIVVATLNVPVWRWLSPHLEGSMRGPVLAYFAVISVMVACALGTVSNEPSPLLAIGAIGFAASDVSVARDQFVEPGFANKAWGLPLYFAAQLCIALGT